MLIALNKPYGVLCQFTGPTGKACLADWISVPDVYPAGRLDQDSEGLLLLTDDGRLQHTIAAPKSGLAKTYWAQVEGIADTHALQQLTRGVMLNDGKTRPATAHQMAPPANLWARVPPIRVRRDIADSWVELTLTEGRNRQVRRMCAAVGHPVLRLVRAGIGSLTLTELGLAPGQWRAIDVKALGIK